MNFLIQYIARIRATLTEGPQHYPSSEHQAQTQYETDILIYADAVFCPCSTSTTSVPGELIPRHSDVSVT